MLIDKIENRLKTAFTGSLTSSNWTNVNIQTGITDDDKTPPVLIFFCNKGEEEAIGTSAYKIETHIQLQTPFTDTATTHKNRCGELEDKLSTYITQSRGYAPLASTMSTGSFKVFGILNNGVSEQVVDDKFVYDIELSVVASNYAGS